MQNIAYIIIVTL